MLLGGGAVLILGLLALGVLHPPGWAWEQRLRDQLESYRPFLPWILRLSAGLPLVGAGFSGYDFAPDVRAGLVPSHLLAYLGFLILLGLFVRPAAAACLLLYLYALAARPHLAEAAEYLALLGGLCLTGPGRPSLDDLLAHAFPALVPSLAGAPRRRPWRSPAIEPYLGTVLRLGLGASLAAVGIQEKLLDPGRSLAVVAKYHLTSVVPVTPGMWVLGAGLVETALGLLLIAGLLTRPAAVLAFLVLSGTFFGLPDDPVLPHTTLFGAATALVVTGAGRLSLDGLTGRLRPRRRESRARTPSPPEPALAAGPASPKPPEPAPAAARPRASEARSSGRRRAP